MPDSFESPSSSRVQHFLPGSNSISQRVQGVVPAVRARLRLLRRKWSGVDLADVRETIERLDPTFVKEGARAITDADVETVVEEANAIEERFRDNGPLRRLLEDGRLLLELVQDIRTGRYQDVPVWTLSAAAFALLYVLNPLYVIPEALPVLGLLDDAAVVSACLALLEQDLYDYRRWRRARADAPSDGEPESEPREVDADTSG